VDGDKDAKAIVVMTRPRGYFDVSRDKMRFDGKTPPGLPPIGAGISTSKIALNDDADRPIIAEFNGETFAGRTWSETRGHRVYLEVTQ
jgi:triacylglycerol lipase